MGLCVTNHLPHVESAQVICGYNAESLGVSLMLCSLTRAAVLGPPLEPMPHQVTGSWLSDGAKFGFHLMEQGLHPIRRWLLTPKMFMPLLHQWVCFAKQSLLWFHDSQLVMVNHSFFSSSSLQGTF